MRKLVLTLALVATPVMAASEAVMHRDPGCGCCEKWAAQVRKAFGRSVRVVDDANRPALQRRVGLPANLASCHTALIDGMAFEGHVPITDSACLRPGPRACVVWQLRVCLLVRPAWKFVGLLPTVMR